MTELGAGGAPFPSGFSEYVQVDPGCDETHPDLDGGVGTRQGEAIDSRPDVASRGSETPYEGTTARQADHGAYQDNRGGYSNEV